MKKPSPRPRSAGPCGLLLLAALLGSSCERADEVEGPRSGSELPAIVTTKSGAEMVRVPAGWLEMGSRDGEADETPVHKVRIDAFLIDRREVTNALYDLIDTAELPDDRYDYGVLGNPSQFRGTDQPVEQVSWNFVAIWCNKRSLVEGLQPCYDDEGNCHFEANGYRLPTEAEWEYACRAGTTTAYSFGGDPRDLRNHAWYAENAAKKAHPVGQKRPNPWRLFDMHGNVGEWCNDAYDKSAYASHAEENPRGPAAGRRYVVRGGSWDSRAEACRSAARAAEHPGFQNACLARASIGFRCVRRAPQDAEGTVASGAGVRAAQRDPGDPTE
jgi:formylglycine-generating enzyme required for sulfatase activity